jgi:hypothetical protein
LAALKLPDLQETPDLGLFLAIWDSPFGDLCGCGEGSSERGRRTIARRIYGGWHWDIIDLGYPLVVIASRRAIRFRQMSMSAAACTFLTGRA